MESKAPTIEISRPTLFTTGAVLVVSAYGILLAVPFIVSVLVVSVTKFSFLTALVPLLVVAATAYFLPFGLGNTHITRLVRSLKGAAAQEEEGFVVQLTLMPRLRSGLRAVLEDADDVGYLSIGGEELRFEGDSVRLSIPMDRIKSVQPQNIGLRGLFVYGPRIKLVVPELTDVESVEFAERSSWLLPGSRAITRQLYRRLSARISSKTN